MASNSFGGIFRSCQHVSFYLSSVQHVEIFLGCSGPSFGHFISYISTSLFNSTNSCFVGLVLDNSLGIPESLWKRIEVFLWCISLFLSTSTNVYVTEPGFGAVTCFHDSPILPTLGWVGFWQLRRYISGGISRARSGPLWSHISTVLSVPSLFNSTNVCSDGLGSDNSGGVCEPPRKHLWDVLLQNRVFAKLEAKLKRAHVLTSSGNTDRLHRRFASKELRALFSFK